LNKLIIFEFDIHSFTRAIDIIIDHKQWVHENIDKEVFEKLKEKEYNRNLPEEKSSTTFFLNELKHESIGQHNDLNINLESFLEYNGKYDIEKEIKDSINENTEEELVSFFKEVLEGDKDPIFKKYKDEKLEEEQFNNALKTIINENEKKTKDFQNQLTT